MTTGWVYAIGIKGTPGRYKVGYSVNPDQRRGNLQTGHYETLTIARQWPTSNMERDEKAIHAILARYRGAGEWFECDLGVIEQAWSTLSSPDPTFGRAANRQPTQTGGGLVMVLPWLILAAVVVYLAVVAAIYTT